jgi:uncharacterized protein YjiS (DUF1127 family)
MRVRVIGAIFRRWRKRRRRRAAIRELRALNDRALKDMGLTRGEIVAAVDGQVDRGEPIRSDQSEPPFSPLPGPARVEPLGPARLQGHLDRARQLRADFIAGLLGRGLGRMVRLLRRAVSASLRRKPARRPTRRELTPPVGLQGEVRRARCDAAAVRRSAGSTRHSGS